MKKLETMPPYPTLSRKLEPGAQVKGGDYYWGAGVGMKTWETVLMGIRPYKPIPGFIYRRSTVLVPTVTGNTRILTDKGYTDVRTLTQDLDIKESVRLFVEALRYLKQYDTGAILSQEECIRVALTLSYKDDDDGSS